MLSNPFASPKEGGVAGRLDVVAVSGQEEHIPYVARRYRESQANNNE
jgi:hypothetical protein